MQQTRPQIHQLFSTKRCSSLRSMVRPVQSSARRLQASERPGLVASFGSMMGRWDWDSATKNWVRPMGFLDLDGLRPHLTVYDWMQDSIVLGAAQKQHSTKQNGHWRRKDILIYPEFWSCFATKRSILHAYVRVITCIYIYTDYIHHLIHKNEAALQLLKWKNQKVCTA